MKLLNITSVDQNRNMHIIYKKNSEVELQSSKTLFWWFSSNFEIFSYRMSVTFESSQDILCLEPKEKDRKKFQSEKNQK